MSYFGENIRKFREQMKWSQDKFADKIIERMQAFGKELSYTNRSISMWENGDRLPSLEVMIAVSDLMGCKIDELLKSNIDEFKAEEQKVFQNKANQVSTTVLMDNQSFIELSHSSETYFVDSNGVLSPFTNGQAKELFEDLREWRLNEARGLPPYCVLDDKTLNTIVDIVPYKINLLWIVQGLGASKIEAYGEKIVEIVNCFLNKFDIIKVLYGNLAVRVNERVESVLGCLGLLNYFGGKCKKNKTAKALVISQINDSAISVEPLTLTEFVNSFNLRTTKAERQARSAIMKWLLNEKLVEEYTSPGGKVSKTASAKGQDFGLITDRRVNAAGYTYYIVLYNEVAQQEILQNLSAIIEQYNSTLTLNDVHGDENEEKALSNHKNVLGRQGQPWDLEEDELLKQEFQDKKTLSEMAIVHQRTVVAIESRLKRLALISYSNEITIEEVK